MGKISLAVITFNEQHNIDGMLNNVYDMFDQIVIVDGCSTDKTIKKIEEYREQKDDKKKIDFYIQPQNAVRYGRGWNQSAQRNIALKHCTGDWIFTIDADERLEEGTRKRLDDLLALTDGYIAFGMPTYHYWERTNQIRVDAHWWPNYHYRFWKNNENIMYSRHSRHCFPVIPDKRYPDVRMALDPQPNYPFTDIVIHHYHHVPVKKSGQVYRANFKDVRYERDLYKRLKVKEVPLRKRTEKEGPWPSVHSSPAY